MVGKEETQKAAVQRKDMCQELANAFALLPLHMLLSYEGALRSLPAPPPHRGSAGLSQEAATRPSQGNTVVQEGATSSVLSLPSFPGDWQGHCRACGDAPTSLPELGLPW